MPLSHEAELSVDALTQLPSQNMKRSSSKGSVVTTASETESATGRTNASSDFEECPQAREVIEID